MLHRYLISLYYLSVANWPLKRKDVFIYWNNQIINPISHGYRLSLALTGGADSAPRSNWMKEGTETQHCYLEVGHLSKWRSHAKIWAPISKIERDFKIFRKSQLSWKKIVFGQKRLPFSQFLIFFVLVFCKQSHFYSV